MKAVLMTSSILIVLVAALRPVLRGRIDPRVQYALWLAVVLRLLIPVNFVTSAYSVLALLERGEEPPRIVQTIGQASIQVMSYEDAYDRAIREDDRISSRYDNIEEWRTTGLSPEEQEMLFTRAQELMRGPTVGEIAAKLAKPVWLTGAALMAGWFLLVNASLRRKLRSARRLNGVDCPLPVYVSGVLPSPCLCGVFRPAIYVTPAALDDPGRLRHVLAHELTHYRHRDHWWALVRCVCLCLYWFNPLVWWAAALSRQDCELACDEGAIRALGEGERIPYGRTLVAMIAAGRNPLLQAATTMTGGKRKVKERVRLIARRPKTVLAVALALALIVAGAVGCTFTGAPEGSTEPDPGPSASAAPDADRPTLDTLRERLADIPEELRGDVVDRRVEVALVLSQSNVLAAYHLNVSDPLWEGMLQWVYQWNQVDFEDWLYDVDTGAFDVFARDSEHYYAFLRPTSVQRGEEDAERFAAAQKAIGEYARQQVLDTQGVEPFDADELRSRESLWYGKTYTTVAYWPYQAVDGTTDAVWIFRLVQLAKDGPAGVWLPERVEYFDAYGNPANIEHIKPDTGGLTVTEYAARLQAEADAGRADWATDPVETLRRYVGEAYGHAFNGVDVPADSFTQDSACIEEARKKALPSPEQQAIQAVMDAIVNADEIFLTLAPGGSSRVYAYAIPSLDEWDENEGFWAYRLSSFATDFQWEKLDAPPVGMDDTTLTIQPKDSVSSIWLREESDIVGIITPDNRTEYYRAASNRYGDAPGTSFWNAGPFQSLRMWFDDVELSRLRTTSVPDRGQSHLEVVEEWIAGFMPYTQCAPGSMHACTYVSTVGVTADQPNWISPWEIENWAETMTKGYDADDFGKTWFGFSFNLVFVPENENAKEHFLAGNTVDYPDEAPEGAQIFTRVGYMELIDGNWVCEGVGTGW